MNHETLCKLKDGDIIRNIGSGNAYTVLRNTGQCVIAARTLEVSNGSEWELVYTTRPVPAEPAGPDRLEMIKDIESRGWTHQTTPCYRWATPDGYFYYDLNAAYASRDLHPTASALAAKNRLTLKGPRTPPSGKVMVQEIEEAGWRREGGMKWKKPGTQFRYPYSIAWQMLENEKVAAVTASGAHAPVKSFAEARAVLVSAGWKNICGKVWKSPSGALVEGTLAAYKIVTCPADTTGDCNAS